MNKATSLLIEIPNHSSLAFADPVAAHSQVSANVLITMLVSTVYEVCKCDNVIRCRFYNRLGNSQITVGRRKLLHSDPQDRSVTVHETTHCSMCALPLTG
jgi:hypothetical protein